MANIALSGSTLGPGLYELLMAGDIVPGEQPSYELCKLIYTSHVLGGKIVDTPIRIAQSQPREILIPCGPEDRLREQFERTHRALGVDEKVASVVRLGKIYGAAAVVYGAVGIDASVHVQPEDLHGHDLYFNVLDPLNTAGSLVLSQNPNAPDFQKPALVTAAGVAYHPSRACIFFNEAPLYIQFTASSFGYTGRSVYQRALYPLKSFVQTMIANDMVARKAGVLVAKMKPAGSIADRAMSVFQGIKRNIVREAQTGNVISITPEEAIETLNMQNTDGALATARKHILEDIAAATPMPAKMLNSESYAEGFGEGSEDAKDVIRYIEYERQRMQPVYDYFDRITMRLAWTPEFYAAMQNDIPEYRDVPYTEAFYRWANAFEARWPSLMIEPESARVQVDEVKFKSVVAALEVLMPSLDPENRVQLIEWAQDSFNEAKNLFPNPMLLDAQALKDYTPPPQGSAQQEPKPFSSET